MTEDRRRWLGGRYRVDGLLGRGGMSEVHYGYDERLDRQVAIKLLRPPSPLPVPADSPEGMEILDARERDRKRFLREIRTTARLELPGAPAVYDTGADGDRLWLVMQLLRGSTLEGVLDRTDFVRDPPGVGWAVAIAAQITAVLADVHRVDIVHRDIKPGNVMIVDGGLVKVLDFGIAILRGAEALPRLTQVDRTVGTPPYMSPEQHLGHVVTAASDVYSLGCLLCELLTGDPPFLEAADRPFRAQHLQTRPPSVRRRRSDVPADIDALVTAMLAKEPCDRPAAAEVYDVLMPLVTGAAGHNGRDPALPFRRPLLAPPEQPAPGTESEPLTDDEFDQLSADVAALLEDDRPAEAIRILEAGLDRAGHDPYLHLQLRYYLADALYSAGNFTRAAPLFDAVGHDYQEHVSSDGSLGDLVIQAYLYAGLAYANIGKAEKALPHLRFYLRHADPDETLNIRFVVAQMLAVAGRDGDALTELQALRPLYAAKYGPHSTQVHNLDRSIERLASSF